MAIKDVGDPEIAQWDPLFVRRLRNVVGPVISVWFRPEVRGLDLFPPRGPPLVVSNHSGGMMTPDVLVFAKAFYDKFGYQRPIYTVAHYGLFIGPQSRWLVRAGVIHASREKAAKALRAGAVVLTFPGGDYDAYRPTLRANVIDFNGRTGYVRTAVEANVPIVPTVSIGAQESQLFLTRGHWLAKRLGLKRIRMEIMPVSFGIPFGFTVMALPPICRYRPKSSPKYWNRSTSPPDLERSRTSARWTSMFAR